MTCDDYGSKGLSLETNEHSLETKANSICWARVDASPSFHTRRWCLMLTGFKHFQGLLVHFILGPQGMKRRSLGSTYP
jgi:hypothetical protein